MKIAIHWFRRDLRWEDNVSLYHALKGDLPVLPLFIFDRNILDQLTDKADRRVDFIHQQILRLQKNIGEKRSSLLVKYGKPLEIWKQLVEEFDIGAVYTNRDYEPYAQDRDRAVYDFLGQKDISFKGYKDHVVFEKNEVLKKDGSPYSIFTPYSKKWLALYAEKTPEIYPNSLEINNFYPIESLPIPSLQSMGFESSESAFPTPILDETLLPDYKKMRDFPASKSTTRLSVHLRFGTISIRKMAEKGKALSAAWLNELIWRDFYQMIIFHFPHSAKSEFKKQYTGIPWDNNPTHFEKWCQGKTGYPMVDAGMRELNQTGFMHNRVRMITACFLTKHLLIDWRWGEAYFANKLLDYEMASNVGGWQWAASTGCDAAPYFRIFNPTSQFQKFDKQAVYIKKWVPEFGTTAYPAPIVEHKMARLRAIETFKKTLEAFKLKHSS